MADHPNVTIVRNAYDSFAKGDLDGALADLADDCVFHFGGDGPNSGDHKGREAITAALIKNFELTEFYKTDPETGRSRELDQIFGPEAQRDYWARLDDLAHDLVELLESAGSDSVEHRRCSCF